MGTVWKEMGNKVDRLWTLCGKVVRKSDQHPPAPQSDAPMQRWTDEALTSTLAYLEAKVPHEWTRDDHCLAVDYITQRYLPHDDKRTEEQWQVARAKLHAKIDGNLLRAVQGLTEEPEWKRLNQEIERRRDLLKSSYFLSQAEFEKIIIPALSRFPFAATIFELSVSDIDLLWIASGDDLPQIPWEKRYEVQDAKSCLVGRFHPSILETCIALRNNYQVLRRSKNAGCEEVKITVRNECRCFGSVINGVHIKVVDALAAFDTQKADAPLLPPPQAACGKTEDPSICHLSLMPTEPRDTPGVETDEEFQIYLDELLGTSKTQLPHNWKSLLQVANV
jgi:hypothetical protein